MKHERGKLVRDNIIGIISSRGKRPVFHTADEAEHRLAVKGKLVEESIEAKDSNTPEELAEELADVFEIVEEICRVYQLDLTEIRRIQKKKREERGGFRRRIILDAF